MEQDYITLKFGQGQRFVLSIPVPQLADIHELRDSIASLLTALDTKAQEMDPKQLKFDWDSAA